MIYVFLKTEIESHRYGKQIENVLNEMQLNKSIITNGNILSKNENAAREKVLKQFRGWRDKEIFANFPEKIKWVRAVFGGDDIRKIIYIEYSYWNEISNYTGSPLEAAETIRSGRTIYNVPNDGFVSLAEEIKNGASFPPLIFLTDEAESRYVILEGHARMTAYGLVPALFNGISVILGFCGYAELDKWYGRMPERS